MLDGTFEDIIIIYHLQSTSLSIFPTIDDNVCLLKKYTDAYDTY